MQRGQRVTGNKAELVARLRQELEREEKVDTAVADGATGECKNQDGTSVEDGLVINVNNVAMEHFKRKHLRSRLHWILPGDFPSGAVIEAYINPRVDPNKDKLSFGKPDQDLLRNFCADRFGWSQAQVDELVLPVIQVWEQRDVQTRINQFFHQAVSFRERFAKIKSKRLQVAIRGINDGASPEKTAALMLEDDCDGGRRGSSAQKKQPKKKKMKGVKGDEDDEDDEDDEFWVKVGEACDEVAKNKSDRQ